MPPPRFAGVFTAIVSPMTSTGDLDLAGFDALVEDQMKQGVDGVVVCGTTGEAATLTTEEQVRLVRRAVDVCDKKVLVIAGAGSNSTRVACENQQRMAALGVDATLQVTPWYNRPTQEGLFQHFRAVAAASSTPVILYNVPSRCGVDLLPETTARIAAQSANVVAIKEATGSVQRADETLQRVFAAGRNDFTLLTGDDGNILAVKAIGGHGVVSVTSHLCGNLISQMLAAFDSGQTEKATELSARIQPLAPALFFRPNPVPVKAALAMTRLRGQISDFVRLPLVPLGEDDRCTLEGMLMASGFGS